MGRPPGFDEDFVPTVDPDWLARWALGQVTLGQSMKARGVAATGTRELVRTLQLWCEEDERAASA
jgi:hypothetical protein